jgi:hypothetical protein
MPNGPLPYGNAAKAGYQPWGDAFWGAVSMLLFAGALVLCVVGLLFGEVQSRLIVAQVGTGFVGVFVAVVGTDFDRQKALAGLGLLLNVLAICCGCLVGFLRIFGFNS